MAEADWKAELGVRTTEILGRFGVAGRVEVENQLVWLIGHGPTVEVRLSDSDLAIAASASNDLKPLAERLARDLAKARRNAAGHAGSGSNWVPWARLIPPIAITVIGVWAAIRFLLPHQSTEKGALSAKGARLTRGLQSQSAKANDRQVLDDQNCLRTVARIQQGGTVSPLDIDGWVVELSLIGERDDLQPNAAALGNYFQMRAGGIERTQHAPNTPLLNQTPAEEAGVLVSKNPLGMANAHGSGITISWRGKYVARYFDPVDRAEYSRLANAIFVDLNATYGALYARCVQGPARYLGSWFRGPTVGGALWMLVAEMDVVTGSASIPLLDAGVGADSWTAPLDDLAARLKGVSRKRAAFVLASTGGTVSERPGQFATVEFPFSPANRANVASATIVHKIWSNTNGSMLASPAAP